MPLLSDSSGCEPVDYESVEYASVDYVGRACGRTAGRSRDSGSCCGGDSSSEGRSERACGSCGPHDRDAWLERLCAESDDNEDGCDCARCLAAAARSRRTAVHCRCNHDADLDPYCRCRCHCACHCEDCCTCAGRAKGTENCDKAKGKKKGGGGDHDGGGKDGKKKDKNKKGDAKKKPQHPVVIQFVHQDGHNELVRLDPPTYDELMRFVKCSFKFDNPRLFHRDKVGYLSPLQTKIDLEHAVRITEPDRYLTIVIAYHQPKPGKPCGCCGRSEPPPKPPKYGLKDPILVHNQAPPGLRSHLVLPGPFLRWNEETPKPPKKKQGENIAPMLKAVMK